MIPVAGHLPDLHFNLTDDKNAAVTEQNYRRLPVLVYFGFTGCSDVCPFMLQRLSALLKNTAARLLFISVDPIHDTPPVLHRYLAHFHSAQITGLTGDPASILRLARDLRAAARTGAYADEPVHATGLYLFDADGHARFLIAPNDLAALPGALATLQSEQK